jgi:phage terminase large subunit GpA-like protein
MIDQATSPPLSAPTSSGAAVSARRAMPVETFTLILAAFAKPLELPPAPRSVLVFARTLKILTHDPDTGADVWKAFVPEDHPAQLEILRDFAAGGYLEFVVLGPVQDGKTTVTIVVGMLFCLIELRQNCCLMLPDEGKALEVWTEKIEPVIRESGYGWILPKNRGVGAGGRGAAGSSMLMGTGARVHLVGAGGQNESAQSSFTVRLAFVDEASKIRPKFIRLAAQRQASYDMHGRFMRTSTLRDGDVDLTLSAWRDSTAARHGFACPLCVAERHPSGGWQVWHHSRVTFDRTSDVTARDTVRLGCIHNAAHRLTDAQRKASLRSFRKIHRGQTFAPDGSTIGPIPDSSSRGFLWSCWDSPLKSMGRIAIEWRKAEITHKTTGDQSALRILYHENFVEPYEEELSEDGINTKALAAQSARSDYEKRQVPHWADYLTIGMDVQKDRVYWVCLAFTASGSRSGFVDWGYEFFVDRGDPSPDRAPNPDEVVQLLHRVNAKLATGWQVAGDPDRRLAPARYGCDVGYSAHILVPWIATNRQWQSCKGVGRDQFAKMDKTTPEAGQDRGASILHESVRQRLLGVLDVRQPATMPIPLVFVGGHNVRTQLHSALMLPAGSPGACWLPLGMKSNDYLFTHLTSEIWSVDPRTNAGYWREVRKDHNHLLDAATYALALGIYHRTLLSLTAAAAAIAAQQAAEQQQLAANPSLRTERRFSRIHRR